MKSLLHTLRTWSLPLGGWCALVGLAVIALGEAALGGGINRTIVTPILHTGDPAPGIAGATVVWVGKPQIDAGGAVSFEGFIEGNGVDASNNLVLWYGPPGGLAVAVREGDQVPGLPAGVVYDDWEVTFTMGEDGTLSVGAILIGPGVIPDVNDKALLVGPAGDLQLMIRAGDPAPGMPPGVIVTPQFNYFAELTDDGRFLTRFILSGPGIDATNDKAYWAVDDTDWHFIVQTGDPAPGTEPGVTFAWIDGVKFNPNMAIAFRAGLTGDTIDFDNDTGYWSGPPGDVQLVAREGDPAPGLDSSALLLLAGSFPSLQADGDVGFTGSVVGDGVTDENERIMAIGPPGDMALVLREDDPVPAPGEVVRYHLFSVLMISANRHLLFAARFRGEVADSRDRAVMGGTYDQPRIVLREGDSVVAQEPGTVFDDRLFGMGTMNDRGDAIQVAGLNGPSVGPENEIIFLLRDHRTGFWYPILREGDLLDPRMFVMDVIQEASGIFWTQTGGSDGLRESINDDGVFAANLTFADGSLGNYLFELPPLGDFDGDGVVDLLDYEAFLDCVTGPGATATPPACDIFDIDWDDDIDHADFGLFQVLIGVRE